LRERQRRPTLARGSRPQDTRLGRICSLNGFRIASRKGKSARESNARMAAPAAPPADFADSASAAASSSSSPNTEPTLPATVFDPDTLVKRGWCTVATDKSRAANPHKLYYGQPPARTCSQFGHRELLTLRSLLQNCMDKMNRRADVWYLPWDSTTRPLCVSRPPLARKRPLRFNKRVALTRQTETGLVRASRLLCAPTGIRRPRL
jgi:hypothetical protein